MQPLQYAQPFLRRRTGYVRRLRQRRIVHLFRNKSRASREEFSEPDRIRDPAGFGDVPHQIGVYIRIKVLLSHFIVGAADLRHTALPYVPEHLYDIVPFRPALTPHQIFKRKVEIFVIYNSGLFPLRQAEQLKNRDSPRERFPHLLHHLVLLGACEPDKPGFVRLIANDFYLLKQLRRFLHLVDQDRRLVRLKKQHRIALRQLSRHCVVHAHIPAVRSLRQMLQHRCLADLTGARDQNRLEEIVRFQNFPFQFPLNICHTRPSNFYDNINHALLYHSFPALSTPNSMLNLSNLLYL